MAIRVVVGAQWGDEGKGKVVDLLSREADYVVRYQGGANAGHTLNFDDREVVLHLIPSGMFNGTADCVIGNGVVVEPDALLEEIEMIESMGFEFDSRLHISVSAHVILPYHRELDQIKEKHRGEDAIGTTGRGIGPAYVSKVSRVGIRMGDLLNPDDLKSKITRNLEDINEALVHVYKEDPIDPDPVIARAVEAADKLAPYIKNTSALLHRAIRDGRHILLEGAQGSMLDIDHGTYPYVTSSSPTAGGACTGSAIPPTAIDHVMGITKAYCTRVGNGPFPTELDDETGEFLREAGSEFGATTGRPRRCGWIDLVALKYAVNVNGMNELAVTKLDVLSGMDEVKLCTSYRMGGAEIREFPLEAAELDSVRPGYKTMDGWDENLRECHSLDELPGTVRAFLEYIEDYLEVDISLLSTGPGRSETIFI